MKHTQTKSKNSEGRLIQILQLQYIDTVASGRQRCWSVH